MTVIAPETEARNQLIKALEQTYAAERFTVKSGVLHRSVGDKETVIGVYPEDTAHNQRDAMYQELNMVVQFYGAYEKKIDRENVVDPTQVEAYAERFRKRMKELTDHGGSPNVWYFEVVRTKYPQDPLGGITRYEMLVRGRGNNTALM